MKTIVKVLCFIMLMQNYGFSQALNIERDSRWVNVFPFGIQIFGLIQHPSKGNTLYLLTKDGIYVSEKDGLFWHLLMSYDHLKPSVKMSWITLNFDPNNDNTLFACAGWENGSNLLRSTDNGQRWEILPTEHPENLIIPKSWKYRHLVSVASSSEIFLDNFSDDFILETFKIMGRTPECEFMVQTKNSTRMFDLSKKITWTENIWLGVTVTSSKNLERIDHLRNTGAKIKWIAFYPLKNEIPAIDLKGIDWVVLGPAIGANKYVTYDRRKMVIIDECNRQGIPFYEKDKSNYGSYKYFGINNFPKDLNALGVI